MQKIKLEDMNLRSCGFGQIDESKEINLNDYIKSDNNCIPVDLMPSKIKYSTKIDRTIYDINVKFDIEGKESILDQFKKLIINNCTIDKTNKSVIL